MFPIPALPLPRLHTRVEPYDARTLALVCGFALAGQAILPWGGGRGGGIMMFWDVIGFTFGQLLIGGALIALYFVWPPALKQGQRVLIVGGAGALGMLFGFGMPGILYLFTPFYVTPFALLGIASLGIGLNLWSRNGYSKAAWIFVVSGVGALGLALLMPIGYGTLPLIGMFTQLGDSPVNIVARIFLLIFALALIFFLVLIVMNLILKKEEADQEQVARYWPVLYFFVPVSMILIGLFTFFSGFSFSLHAAIVFTVYLTLAVWGGTIFVEARLRGENLMEL